ncbi:uncharacterized protein LOC109834759 [Asparagus officinalis]|uniref:uncharacterized protein LOC109834759 n=1 Tax=Asparagus officinalis TaxID=4686 RepID=UPI00098E7B51|nr:uncharacterized protein LOC109834759 [Asparagus officinalis]
MESYVNKLWGNIFIPNVSLIKQGLFLFDFQSEKSMREVLEAGPWLNLWSSIGISKVASLIGKPIATDKLTANRERLSYARVLLEVKLLLKDPLPDQLNIQGPDGISYTQSVIYEYKPKWCSLCSKIGHDTEQCRRIKTKKMWVPVIRQAENHAQMNVAPELSKEPAIIPGLDRESFVQQTSEANINTEQVVGKSKETLPAGKHAQTEKHAHAECRFGGKGISIYPANDSLLFSTPIVNTSGFSSVNRANLTRRSTIGILEFSVIISTDQYITCTIGSRDGKFSSLCTIVYAQNQMANRKTLWRDLLAFKNSVNGPWIIGGDFNVITSYDEKIGAIEDDVIDGKRPFKFCNMWVNHPEFIPTVKKVWEQNIKGYKIEQVLRAKDGLADVQRLLNGDPFNSDLIKREKECIKKYDRLLECESSFYKQKANNSWSLEGDKGSKFFHSIMKKKRHHNRILTLYTERGDRITDSEIIISEIVGYYKKLMGILVPTTNPDPMVIANGPLLSHDQRQALSSPVSRDEIKKAIFSMSKDKNPGPDGYSALFFKASWSIISEELFSAVEEFFNSGKLLGTFNTTSITLIPKILNPQYASDFRPISCCNCVYKIITKIIATRIQGVMGYLISDAQSAFIKGRLISSNILLAHEIVKHYGRKHSSPRAILNIDLRKEFDTISWEFIREMLIGLKFSENMISWIMECISTPKFSISINGILHGYFHGARGLRQGDPLSPYLFVIGIEYLSRKLSMLKEDGFYKFHPKCSGLNITHLVFTDDLLMLGKADMGTISRLKNFLTEFSQNYAMTAKLLWMIHLKKDILWIKWIHGHYLRHSNIWQVQSKKCDSWLWRQLLRVRNLLIEKLGSVNNLQNVISGSCVNGKLSVSVMCRKLFQQSGLIIWSGTGRPDGNMSSYVF